MDPMELGKLVWGFIQNFGAAFAPAGAGALAGIEALRKRRRQHKQFKVIFGVSWPKNNAQRKATASMVLQIYQVLKAQGDAAQEHLAHFILLGRHDAGPTVREFMKQLSVILGHSQRAKKLLQQAGYVPFI